MTREPSSPYAAWLAQQSRRLLVVRLSRLAILLVVFGAWEVLPRLKLVNPMLTSYPSAMFATFLELTRASPSIFSHTLATTFGTTLGFAVSMVLGVLGASLLWWSETLYEVVDPYLVIVNAMPKVAFVPIFYLWLGPSLSVYAISLSISLFVSILMIRVGFASVDPAKVRLARSLGATRMMILRKVIYPGSIPTLVGTMKVSVGLCLVGTVVGEFQSATMGLGYLIQYGSQVFKLDIVLMSVGILALLSTAMYLGIARLEAAVLRRGWGRPT
jgi:NitT/TauT family transport system permease protein